jgi:hypothetical protein
MIAVEGGAVTDERGGKALRGAQAESKQ